MNGKDTNSLALRLWFLQRGWLLAPLLATVAVTGALYFSPGDLYWEVVFEGLRLYLWWPALVILGSTAFLVSGLQWHKKTGLPLLSPILASLAALGYLSVEAVLFNAWAADWSLPWCLFVIVALTLVGTMLIWFLLAHCEAWRLLLNGAVVRSVTELLKAEHFLQYLDNTEPLTSCSWTERLIAWLLSQGRSFGLLAKRPGGSLHCLRIVEAHYRNTRAAILRPDVEPEILHTFLSAANTLAEYLMLPWAPTLLSKAQRRWWIMEIRREMLTQLLWHSRCRATVRTVLPSSSVALWIDDFRKRAALWSPSYAGLLEAIFETAVQDVQAPLGEARVRGHILNSIRFFNVLAAEKKSQGDDERNLNAELRIRFADIAASTWAALAPARLSAGLGSRVWLDIRSVQGRRPEWPTIAEITDPNLPAFLRTNESEPVLLWCLHRLQGWHTADYEAAPRHYNSGPLGKLHVVQGLIKMWTPPTDNELNFERESRNIGSWPYRQLFHSRELRLAFGIGVLAVSISTGVLVSAVAPKLPANWGWNTVEHVSDRRTGEDYSRAIFTSLAVSKDWLALASANEGVTLINKASRIARERTGGNSVLDVTRGISNNSFLILCSNQSILTLKAPGWPWTDPSTNPWLAAPSHAVWPVSNTNLSPDILANVFDPDGWLIAARGWGVARYHMDQSEAGFARRSRSWDLGADSTNCALAQAVITSNIVLIAVEGGGLRAVERKTLAEIPGATAITPPIKRLDADYLGDWAMAVDKNNSLWLQSSRRRGWSGPLLGKNDGPGVIGPASTVRMARLDEPMLWLGTDAGVFGYASDRRRMLSLASGRCVALEPLGSQSRADMRRMITATGSGLLLCSERSEGSVECKVLDQDPLTAFGMDADQKMAAYCAATAGNGSRTGVETRCIGTPFEPANISVIVPARGWTNAPSESPIMRGVRSLGKQQLFITSGGAFLYDPPHHSYQDCSQALYDWIDNNVTNRVIAKIRSIGQVSTAQNNKVALCGVVEGKPTPLELTHIGEGWQWIGLAYPGATDPIALTYCSNNCLGLGRRGQLYAYNGQLWPPTLLDGTAPHSAPTLLQPTNLLGDLLLPSNQAGSLSFVNGSWVGLYDFSNGRISEYQIPNDFPADSELKQIQLTGNNEWNFLYSDGRCGSVEPFLNNLHMIHLFGVGSMSFAPGSVSAITTDQEDSNDAHVIVAARNGHVMNYDWKWGSWSDFSPTLPNLDDPNGIVTDLLPVFGGLVIQADTGCVLYGDGKTWTRLAGATRAAATARGINVWTCGQRELTKWEIAGGKSAEEWKTISYYSGKGLQEFLKTEAKYCWALTSNRVAVFSAGHRYGVYDQSNESWDLRQDGVLQQASQFIPLTNGLLVLDQPRVLMFDQQLGSREIFRLPPNLVSYTLYSEDSTIKLTYTLKDGQIVLLSWNDGAAQPTRFSRGGICPLNRFDPRQVVYAESAGDESHLVDAGGNILAYEPAKGEWRLLRGSEPGQILFGVAAEQDGNGTELYLEVPGTNGVLLSLSKEGAVSRTTLDAPSSGYLPFLQTQIARSELQATSWKQKAADLRRSAENLACALQETNALITNLMSKHFSLEKEVVEARAAAPTNPLALASNQLRRSSLETQLLQITNFAGSAYGHSSEIRVKMEKVQASAEEADLREKEWTAKALAITRRRQWLSSHLVADNRLVNDSRSLLQDSRFRVSRTVGVTSYNWKTDSGEWIVLQPREGGFLQDSNSCAVFGSGGTLLALQGGGVVSLSPEPSVGGLSVNAQNFRKGVARLNNPSVGHVCVRYADGGQEWCDSEGPNLRPIPPPMGRVLAQLNYGSEKLLWQVSADDRIELAWASGKTNLWATDASGKLSVQSVHDLALLAEKRIVVSTDAGLIVRDADSFEIRQFIPFPRPLTLVTLQGPHRILALNDANPIGEWENGQWKASPSSENEMTGIQCGPWAWWLSRHATNAIGSLCVIGVADHSLRSWVRDPANRYRFTDDYVHWLVRGDPGSTQLLPTIWLATGNGLWLFDRLRGRREAKPLFIGSDIEAVDTKISGSPRWMDKSHEWHPLSGLQMERSSGVPRLEANGIWSNAAIKVKTRLERIELEATDTPRPVFTDGRFFFDCAEQLEGTDNNLYALISNRAVIRRDATNAAALTGFWPLPMELQTGNTCVVLNITNATIQLFRDDPSQNIRTIWSLNPAVRQSTWIRQEVGLTTLDKAGEIVWARSLADVHQWESYVSHEQQLTKLADWWSGDRFTWDRIIAACGLSGEQAVLLSQAGPVVVRNQPGEGFPISEFWPTAGLSACVPARVDGRIVGVEVHDLQKQSCWLIKKGVDGRIIRELIKRSLEQHGLTSLVRKRFDASARDLCVGFRETWISSQNLPSSAFSSSVPELPSEQLIHDGQFIFDVAKGAGQLSQSDEWVTFGEGALVDGMKGIWCVNEFYDDFASKRRYFLLRNVRSCDAIPEAIRSNQPLEVCAVYAPTDGGSNWSFRFSESNSTPTAGLVGLNLQRKFNEIQTRFQVGHTIQFAPATVSWVPKPRYFWEANSPCFAQSGLGLPKVQGAYPLFCDDNGGKALAFDVFQTISLRASDFTLAIGTRGGLWVLPREGSGIDSLNSSLARFCPVIANQGGMPAWCAEICRVRQNTTGEFVLGFGAGGKAAEYIGGQIIRQPLDIWGLLRIDEKGSSINVTNQRLWIRDKLSLQSNNAWWLGRRSIQGVVELMRDPYDGEVWCCTRNNGLFKIIH